MYHVMISSRVWLEPRQEEVDLGKAASLYIKSRQRSGHLPDATRSLLAGIMGTERSLATLLRSIQTAASPSDALKYEHYRKLKASGLILTDLHSQSSTLSSRPFNLAHQSIERYSSIKPATLCQIAMGAADP